MECDTRELFRTSLFNEIGDHRTFPPDSSASTHIPNEESMMMKMEEVE
jgi:hypothetical protein